jgi:hypothetical protein
MDTIVKNLKTMTDEEYAKKVKETRHAKAIAVFTERKKKYDKHYRICQDVFNALFEMSDVLFIRTGSRPKGWEKPSAADPP